LRAAGCAAPSALLNTLPPVPLAGSSRGSRRSSDRGFPPKASASPAARTFATAPLPYLWRPVGAKVSMDPETRSV